MKRNVRFKFVIILILLVPFVFASGQDNHKREQKIKVIVDDGSGKKVIIDTVYKDSPAPDSIKLKDGSTVYIEHIGDRADSKHHKGDEHIFINYADDKNSHAGKVKEITVFSSDSLQLNQSGDSDLVYFYGNSHDGKEGKQGDKYTVITRSSPPRGHRGERSEMVYLKKDRSSSGEDDKTFDVYVSNDDNDSDMEQTRLVIAKNGMVVTIEGNDEAKAKELAKIIEQNLGVSNDNKEITKTVTKKEIKK
jgi:hypothetical protein